MSKISCAFGRSYYYGVNSEVSDSWGHGAQTSDDRAVARVAYEPLVISPESPANGVNDDANNIGPVPESKTNKTGEQKTARC